MSRIRILASPAYRNEAQNPYNALLSRALAQYGCDVSELSARQLFTSRAAIWHIHWPDLAISGPTAWLRLKGTLEFLVKLVVAKLRGIKIVWTVHNLMPHDKRADLLQAVAYRVFILSLSGYISLSRSARDAALSRYPRLRSLHGFVIPHGHYKGVHPDSVSKAEARALLTLPSDAEVYLFLGQIRPYKNLPVLIDAFRKNPAQNAYLIIAGHAPDPGYRHRIRELAQSDKRVICSMEFVETDHIQHFMRAADVVVLPYQEILNSGSAILALSYERPVVVPRIGSLAELEQVFGSTWVHVYSGKLSAEVLIEAMAQAKVMGNTHVEQLHTAMEQLSWSHVAKLTASAYRLVLAGQWLSKG